MTDESRTLLNETSTELAKNCKVDIKLEGTPGAICVGFISACFASISAYAIYAWHDVEAKKISTNPDE